MWTCEEYMRNKVRAAGKPTNDVDDDDEEATLWRGR